jgi:hypothetical protein
MLIKTIEPEQAPIKRADSSRKQSSHSLSLMISEISAISEQEEFSDVGDTEE